jgi:hypothetical protein
MYVYISTYTPLRNYGILITRQDLKNDLGIIYKFIIIVDKPKSLHYLSKTNRRWKLKVISNDIQNVHLKGLNELLNIKDDKECHV